MSNDYLWPVLILISVILWVDTVGLAYSGHYFSYLFGSLISGLFLASAVGAAFDRGCIVLCVSFIGFPALWVLFFPFLFSFIVRIINFVKDKKK